MEPWRPYCCLSSRMAKAKFNELIASDRPTLVDFSAEWCGPCKMMAPVLSELKGMMGDRISVIKIDVDRNPEIASNYQVRSVPTLILFKGGALKWQQSGVVPAAQLRKVIEQVGV